MKKFVVFALTIANLVCSKYIRFDFDKVNSFEYDNFVEASSKEMLAQ
jgi:hypothetical protein